MDDKETLLAKLKGWEEAGKVAFLAKLKGREEAGKVAHSKWQRCYLEDVVDAQSFKRFERMVKELHTNLYGEGRYE